MAPATGTNILPGTRTALTGTLHPKGPEPHKGKAVLPKALNKFNGFRVQGGDVPAMLRVFLYHQPMGFSDLLEPLIVVQPGSGSVLNAILKVLTMNHFMNQSSAGFVKGPIQVFGAKVDFVVTAIFAILPGFPAGAPPV